MKKIVYFLTALMFLAAYPLNAQEKNDSGTEGKVYTVVDKLPSLEGFKRNYKKYFRTAVVYPKEAFMKGIEGTVYVSFVVTTSGEVRDVFISRSSNNLFNAEALRVIQKTSGRWKPGQVDKQPVNTRMVLPVKFYLDEDDKSWSEILQKFEAEGVRPLYVLDKKIVTGVVRLADYDVRSIRVLKGKKAIEMYGEAGKNGVVEIMTKNGVDPIYKMN
jgi:TonB family protein